MPVSYLRVFDEPREPDSEHTLILGAVVKLVIEEKRFLDRPIRSFLRTIKTAIDQRRIRLFYDEHGRPAGYVVWAALTEEAGARAQQEGQFALHESEWNEGSQLWLVEYVHRDGVQGKGVRHLLRESLRRFGSVRLLGRKGAHERVLRLDPSKRRRIGAPVAAYCADAGLLHTHVDNTASQLAYAITLLRWCERPSSARLFHIAEVVAPAIRRDAIKYFFNDDGYAVGYVVWTVAGCGTEIEIFDIVAPFRNLKYMCRSIREMALAQNLSVRFTSRRSSRCFCRPVSRISGE